ERLCPVARSEPQAWYRGDVLHQHRGALLVDRPDHAAAWRDSEHLDEIERIPVGGHYCKLVLTSGDGKRHEAALDTAGHVPDEELADGGQSLDSAQQTCKAVRRHTETVTALVGRVRALREVSSGAAFPPGNPVVRARIARVVRIHDEIARLSNIGFVTAYESA